MIKNEKTKEDIEQSTENHRAAVAICDAPIEEIENRIVTLKREKEAYDAEEEERTIQRRLEEERRILEMQMEMKKKKKKRKKKRVFLSSLNDFKFSKTKLPLTSTGLDLGISSKVRLNKLRVNVCSVRNLTIDLRIVKLQKL